MEENRIEETSFGIFRGFCRPPAEAPSVPSHPCVEDAEDTDDTDDSVVVDFSLSGKVTMTADGVRTEFEGPSIIQLAIPILPYKTQSWFGKEKIEMMCTWKLVLDDNGELCLHWTIEEGFDKLLHMPEELMVKTVFGDRKKSATGKGYKYEIPISCYTYYPQSSKLVFNTSNGLLPLYCITAFMDNCLMPCHEVIALLNQYHPRAEVPSVCRADADDGFTPDAEVLFAAPTCSYPPNYTPPYPDCPF